MINKNLTSQPFPYLNAQRDRLNQLLSAHFSGRTFWDEPMSKHTSLRVGGPALVYLYPNHYSDLSTAIQIAQELELQLFIIGYGTNLLVSDEGFPGMVIDLNDCCREITFQGNEVEVGSGVWLGDLVRLSAEKGLSGLEKLAGIPGGVGGALAMNAGAFGSSISQQLIKAKVMDYKGNVFDLSPIQINFGYRSAPGFANLIILKGHFVLNSTSPRQAIEEVEATITERFRRNVMTLPSAGSVFKNPPGHFAAKLIESVGGKGMREGGVEISSLHSNFILNTRGGTAQDIVRLIQRIRQLVWKAYGVNLQLEIKTLGFKEAIDGPME